MASQFKIFYLRGASGSDDEEELNRFLRCHHVVKVERFFSSTTNDAFWTFCVEYLLGAPPETPKSDGAGDKTPIDYRDVLSDEDFQVYAKLREWRKARAVALSVRPYVIFTNAQLADIATRRPATVAELGKIKGVGPGKLEDYGAEVVAILQEAPPRKATSEEETGSPCE